MSRTLLALLLCHACAAPKSPAVDSTRSAITTMVFDVVTSEVIVYPVDHVSSDVVLSIGTYDVSPGSDTVIALWDADNAKLVAMNDDRYPGQPESLLFVPIPPDRTGGYVLLVWAKRDTPPGTCDLQIIDNHGIPYTFGPSDDQPFAGTFVDVPTGADLSYQTALTPGGTSNTVLLAFDAIGHLVAFDDDDGIGPASRTPPRGDVAHVLVGSPHLYASGGATRLYVNDVYDDFDADGLGIALERALETCPDPSEPGCANVFNTADTDRDGLSDGVEVFGHESIVSGQALLFSAWGANPRRKDVFVEVDYRPPITTPGSLTADQARTLVMLYNDTDATEVQNPDGSGGVSLHLDTGRDPTDPADLTLFGAWGGSRVGPDEDLDVGREGFFFHIGWRDPSTSVGPPTLGLFTHENGHSLGLPHEGAPDGSWGLNCSPIRPSTMSYSAAAFATAGYDDGRTYPDILLNPSALCEQAGLGGHPTAHLVHYGLDASPGTGVDWDRDGTISDCTRYVRAPINWYTPQGCDARSQGWWEDRPLAASGATQHALAHLDGFLYAFYLQGGVVTYQRSAQSDEFLDAGCEHGFDTFAEKTACSAWSVATAASFDGGPRTGLNVFSTDGRLYVTYVSDGKIRMRSASHDARGDVTWDPEVEVGYGDRAPEMGLVYGDPLGQGLTRSVVLVWPDASGILVGAAFDPTVGTSTLGSIGALAGAETPPPAFQLVGPIESSALTPAITFRGADDGGAPEDNQTWMLVLDDGGRFQIYVYDGATNIWRQNGENLNPDATITHRFGFAFRPNLDGTGAVRAPLVGDFQILFTDSTPLPPGVDDGNCSETTSCALTLLWASNVLLEGEPLPESTPCVPGHRCVKAVTFDGHLTGFFAQPYYYGNVANGGDELYTAPGFPNLKALHTRNTAALDFFPYADGVMDKDFRSESEFLLLERGICMRLGHGESWCGSALTTVGGY